MLMDTWVFNIKIDYTRNTKINEKKKKKTAKMKRRLSKSQFF